MNTEEDEFRRIEEEAKRQAVAEDDDTQTFTSESADAYAYRCGYEAGVVAERKAQRRVQEPVAYKKTELNCFAQDLYDQKMREGKHGHYESMFHVIHQCVKKVASPPPQRQWVGLTDEDLDYLCHLAYTGDEEFALTVQAKLKEKNT